MVYLVGASCLANLTRTLDHKDKRRFQQLSYSKPGLSLNPRAKDKYKTVQHLFQNKFVLLNRKRIVIWHDGINNSITPHRSNNNRPLSPEQLIEILKKLNSNGQIEAIVYTRRAGTPDLSIDLRQTGILILEATKNLSSRRKQANFKYLYQLTQVHPETHIDLKLVTTILLNCRNLRKLIKKKRSKKPAKKKPNKRQKDRKKKRESKKAEQQE